MDFKVGQQVKIIQRGTLKIGGMELTDNSFSGSGITIAAKNADGTYSVTGIIGGQAVPIPADWIHSI